MGQRAALLVRRAATGLIGLIIPVAFAFADGNETLGPPSIAIAAGSGYVAKGVGLAVTQPATINITIPAGATIRQVLLYWEGQHTTPAGDNSIIVGGIPVTGALIGGPDYFFGSPAVYSSTYRADITTLGLVAPGANAITVGGLSFSRVNNGAGLLVIIDDGTTHSDIMLRDGNDLAYRFFPNPRQTTVAQTFTFDPSPFVRSAKLSMFFSSVQGTASTGGPQRPNRITISIGGVTTNADDVLNSGDGEEWDTYTTVVTVPAGVTQMTVQAISGPGGDEDPNTQTPRPASFAWIAAGLSVPCTGIIGDFVWFDADCDGSQETGEVGIANVTVKLFDNTNALLATDVTDASGHYEFTGLCSGTYSVVVDTATLPAGYTPTTCSNTPNVATNSNCSPSPVVLTGDAGEDLTIDFGYCGPPQGGEGCTPGYWKQSQHFGSWPSPYTPQTLFGSVFENAFPGKTFLQVLSTGGGGLIALGRHTVAALLNAQSGGVDYNLTAAQVISMFNAVYPAPDSILLRLKDVFEDFNEQGCPLNRAEVPVRGSGATALLFQNYPNPFNPSTEVSFQIPEAGQVRISVFNTLGQQVKVLADAPFEAGTYSVTWDATDQSGNALTSGIYFCQLRIGSSTQMLKMTLMR